MQEVTRLVLFPTAYFGRDETRHSPQTDHVLLIPSIHLLVFFLPIPPPLLPEKAIRNPPSLEFLINPHLCTSTSGHTTMSSQSSSDTDLLARTAAAAKTQLAKAEATYKQILASFASSPAKDFPDPQAQVLRDHDVALVKLGQLSSQRRKIIKKHHSDLYCTEYSWKM